MTPPKAKTSPPEPAKKRKTNRFEIYPNEEVPAILAEVEPGNRSQYVQELFLLGYKAKTEGFELSEVTIDILATKIARKVAALNKK